MKNFIYKYGSIDELREFTEYGEFAKYRQKAESVLIQIYSAKNEQLLLNQITGELQRLIPCGVIVGTTTVGEIMNGELLLNEIILSFSVFKKTKLTRVHCCCDEINEEAAGELLIRQISMSGDCIAGVMILATTLTVDAAKVLKSLSKDRLSFPVFGGGAGVYDTSRNSVVFDETSCFRKGLIAVIFLGSQCSIECRTSLGWRSLSQEMTITKAEGMVVRKVDDMDGFDLYHKYLNINNDGSFFQNVLEFPFLIERNGYTLARVPFYAHEDNSIEFVSDIIQGERFRIGYGDPEIMLLESEEIRKSMDEFEPDAIMLFACICRRFLLQTDVDREMQPFQCIAPTSGFFTYGEFYSVDHEIKLQNASIVVVGIKETYGRKNRKEDEKKICREVTDDLYSDKHNRIISHLLHFIKVLSSDLEESNQELIKLSEIDKTTMIYNRRKLDGILDREMALSRAQRTRMTVIMFDIDYYKEVNDRYGHLTGDKVLVELAEMLLSSIRRNDFVGRWGGEEFLMILPITDTSSAIGLAERVRKEIDKHIFDGGVKGGLHLTCSLGVAELKAEDTVESLIGRADRALYAAKEKGRNCVIAAD